MTTDADVVPPFKVDLSADEIDRAVADVRTILEGGRLTLGAFTERFETEFAEAIEVDHAVSANSGSSALEIIYRAIDVADKEVLVPSNTNFATAAAVVHAGGKPVLYDGGLYPSLADIEARLTADSGAVVVVHIGGYLSPDLGAIRALCDDRGIAFVEDAAHAHGASLDGRQAGTFGHAAAFSFFPTKVITTGEGGMIVTNDRRLAELARSIRDQGKDSSGVVHVHMGNSWRLTEFGCAIGLAQLPAMHTDTAFRWQVIQRYAAELDDCPGLTFPETAANLVGSGYKAVAVLDAGLERDVVYAAIAEEGVIMSRPVYEVPLHRQPVFEPWVSGSLSATDDFCDRHICFPLWRFITDEQQARVVEAVRSVLSKGNQ